MKCVAAPRAAVPNTASAGSAVATAPLIASGLIVLLLGRPCAGGLACAAACALRQADARTLRQADAWARHSSCALARRLRLPRAQRSGDDALRRRLEALFCWSGAAPVPRAELLRWCERVHVTACRRSFACATLLRRFALAVEHRRRALAAATGARRTCSACCKPLRAVGTARRRHAEPAESGIARPWRRCTPFCVGSETAREMRNAGRAFLCVYSAASYVPHACPRGGVAAQHAPCHATRSSSRLRSMRTQAQQAACTHAARACPLRCRVEANGWRAAATRPPSCRVERCGAAAQRMRNQAFAACAAAPSRSSHVHCATSYLCTQPTCVPPRAQVRHMQRTLCAARCDAKSAQMRTSDVARLDADVKQRSRAACTRPRRAARLCQVQHSVAARRHMRKR
jgi:hypothetical protein